MSTAYYLYHIPDKSYSDWRTSLDECIKRKEMIGVWTLEGTKPTRRKVFRWVMHPGDFMYDMISFHDFHAVYEEGGRLMMLASFLKMLADADIVCYDKENIPA